MEVFDIIAEDAELPSESPIMDQLRRQAYQNLIDALLTCDREERMGILQANLELIDEGFAQFLRRDWATQTLAKLQGGKAFNWAIILSQFLRQDWATQTLAKLQGGKAFNCAIVLYNLNLGFSSLGQGSRASNLEVAIACLEIGLTVITRKADSKNWAAFQNSLGNAYRNRIRGEKAENLELAIAAYLVSLEVRTREAFPQDWATTKDNLGIAYGDRIRGEKAENLELAISAYLASLEVRTREAFPQDSAKTQNNLATAYFHRIRGERAENIEKAIAIYQASLEVYTREAFPFEWARSQNNLEEAYRNRVRGEKADNIEMAISASQAALNVYTRESFPFEWAATQNNLAAAYSDRIRGEKADNIEMAIAAYREALKIYTREVFPENWATIQNNLGNAYSDRIRGEKADNIEMAIAADWEALKIYTREAFPENWATTQNNLGNAYLYRIRGEKTENLERAIAAYLASLEVYTREAFPIDNATTLYNLGLAYRHNSQLPAAYDTFNTAIETVELMRSEIIIGGEADRQKLAEKYNIIYQAMVEVCLAMANQTAALEYVERSKTRNLVELFYNARSVQQNVQRISFAEIGNLLAEDEAILEWYITFNGFKVFIVTYQPPQPPLSKGGLRIQPPLSEGGLRIQPPLSEGGLRIQPPLSNGGLRRVDVWESSYRDLQALEEFQREYIDDIKDNEKYDNWKNQLETRLEKLAEILHIDEIISRLPETCQRLILVPFRYLHLLPLHALTSRRLRENVEKTGCLLDLFPGGVRYTPSCQLLQLSQRQNPPGEDSSPRRLFAIQNPNQNTEYDLPLADIEVEAIAKSFNPAEVLIGEKATKAAFKQQIEGLQNADIAHFACHGSFDFSNPRKSALILAGAKIATDNVNSEEKSYIRSRRGETFDITQCVTLTEIFDLKLNKCSLVTLSACETGLTDIRDTTDEYIGLPSGFFYAGATNVISTLWAVNDVSTAILMIKFYEILLSESRPPVAIALRESQLWLREASVQDLLEWVADCQLIADAKKQEIQDYIKWGKKLENKPYQSPHFWAAFCAVGQ
jgi:CHAT domain-containing protein